MRTAIGLSLLVVGLVIGIGVSAVLSLGTIVTPAKTSTATTLGLIFTTVVFTSTTTLQETLTATTPGSTSSAYSQSTQTKSQGSASSDVTITGIVSASGGTPYQVTLTPPSGATILISVLASGAISASVPNDQNYLVIVYYYTSAGGTATCNAAELNLEAQTPFQAVDFSC